MDLYHTITLLGDEVVKIPSSERKKKVYSINQDKDKVGYE